MKKSLIALAALAAVSAASAQSTLTMSGNVEVGAYKAIDGRTLIGTDRVSNTYITIAATEDLGGGLKAGFMAQMRLNPGNAGQANSTYTYPFEQVKTSISGGFGEVALGKFTNVLSAPAGTARLLGSDDSLKAYSGLSSAAARTAGQVQYTSPSFMGFKVGAVSAVNSVANASAVPTTTSGTATGKNLSGVAVSYSADALQANLASAKNIGGTVGSDTVDAGFSYDFGMAKVLIGRNVASAATAADKTETGFGVEVPVGKALRLGMAYASTAQTGAADTKRTSLVAQYTLSKRTAVLVRTLKASGSTTATSNGNGSFIGMTHSF